MDLSHFVSLGYYFFKWEKAKRWTLADYVSEWVNVLSHRASCYGLMNASSENEGCKIHMENAPFTTSFLRLSLCLSKSADQICCYLRVHSWVTSSTMCPRLWMWSNMQVERTRWVLSPPVHLYSAFLSMLTILLNFNLVAMSNGVSPSWGEKNRRSEPAGGVRGSLGTSTYTVANVDIGVLLQQQGHQTPTLSLADVVKCCIPLLTSKHMSSISTALLQLIWTKNVL